MIWSSSYNSRVMTLLVKSRELGVKGGSSCRGGAFSVGWLLFIHFLFLYFFLEYFIFRHLFVLLHILSCIELRVLHSKPYHLVFVVNERHHVTTLYLVRIHMLFSWHFRLLFLCIFTLLLSLYVFSGLDFLFILYITFLCFLYVHYSIILDFGGFWWILCPSML
ncbi:hypothetical protein DM860_014132 [Cuscuta australis]|uniref:Uncharacterized protein n=1 Tax=Cuscuta australis TaxID=267555 RepID=A0A328DDZ0_9ASTE|nr:hypothetical protein DM860_014132 [Cuscuta australis]